MQISGRCLCGGVSYQTSMAPVFQFNCHCRDCQRSTGAAFAPVAFFPAAAFSLQGELRYYAGTAASGQTIRRGFCPTCGAQVVGETTSAPGVISIRAGTLDDLSVYQPHADIFVSQAAPWDCMNPELAKFSAMPPR